jgi:hypothetical protein
MASASALRIGALGTTALAAARGTTGALQGTTARDRALPSGHLL